MSNNIPYFNNVCFAKPAYDLFYQFCFQVMNIAALHKLSNCYYAVFGPLTWFTGAGANILLKEFERTFEFLDGMCRYSSGYGYRPNLGDFRTGVDFAGATGTNIWAADGGVVIHSGWKGNYGYCVIIDHQNGYTTYYAHCSKLLVKKGAKVAKGDIIAKVGNTGRSYGSHVHFEIRKNGKHQNPLTYISKY